MTYKTLVGQDGSDVYKRCLAIRIAVFVDEQKFTMEDELDEKDAASDHLLVVDVKEDGTEEDVGTIRWWPKPDQAAGKMGRVAVVQKYRGSGLGRVLIEALHDHLVYRRGKAGIAAKGQKSVLSIAHSQAYAQGFYERNGYVREGDLFLEDGADHCRMVREITLCTE
ncbi:hypothetical protein JCM10212_006937 [Sporobolomyces blumeae]